MRKHKQIKCLRILSCDQGLMKIHMDSLTVLFLFFLKSKKNEFLGFKMNVTLSFFEYLNVDVELNVKFIFTFNIQ